LFAGLPDYTLAPLQRVFHAAARFVDNLRPRDNNNIYFAKKIQIENK